MPRRSHVLLWPATCQRQCNVRQHNEVGISLGQTPAGPSDHVRRSFPILWQRPRYAGVHGQNKAGVNTLMVLADRSHQGDFVLLLTFQDQASIDIPCIHHMRIGEQRVLGKGLMNCLSLFDIGFCCIGGYHMGDEVRNGFITRFAEMNLVAVPGEIAFVPIMGLVIVRRTDGQVSRRQIILVTCLELAVLVPALLLDPGAP